MLVSSHTAFSWSITQRIQVQQKHLFPMKHCGLQCIFSYICCFKFRNANITVCLCNTFVSSVIIISLCWSVVTWMNWMLTYLWPTVVTKSTLWCHWTIKLVYPGDDALQLGRSVSGPPSSLHSTLTRAGMTWGGTSRGRRCRFKSIWRFIDHRCVI